MIKAELCRLNATVAWVQVSCRLQFLAVKSVFTLSTVQLILCCCRKVEKIRQNLL